MRRLRLLAIFAALAVLAFLMLDPFARSMLYPAPPVTVPSPPPSGGADRDGGLTEERLRLVTGGEVYAWSLEPPGVPAGAPVAVFLHGNGENLETMRRSGLFDRLRRMAVVTLAVDYPGYGRSAGRTTEEGVIASASAVLAWAREQHPERPVVLVGWSLGAAAALGAAARDDGEDGGEVAGVAALSPWSRLEDVAAVHFPRFLVGWAVRERYDSLAATRTIAARGVPTLVIHGGRDTIIPVEQGRRIAETLREGYPASLQDPGGTQTTWLEVPEAGHNDLLGYPEVWDALDRFLRELSGG
jgi:pimeloyl-ACP methyl ester carboxylesterase